MKEIGKLDLAIEKLGLAKKKIISISQFIELFESDASLKVEMTKRFQNMPEKYAKSKSARVIHAIQVKKSFHLFFK